MIPQVFRCLNFNAYKEIIITVSGALKELAYAEDVLKADGFALPSSFGEGADASKSVSALRDVLPIIKQNISPINVMIPSGQSSMKGSQSSSCMAHKQLLQRHIRTLSWDFQ